MLKFYLERPSMERKDEIIEYLDEFKKYNSNINGVGSLDRIYDGYTFEEALERCLKLEDEEFAKTLGWCPGKTFMLIRHNDTKIIGMINIRWNLNEYMLRFAGHIGYSIRPTERRKGYNKINLYLGLIEAKKLGLDKVMLGCNASNLGSDKTIQALGGILERAEIDPRDNELDNIYWINVDESIEKYKNEYDKYIYKKTVRK